MSGRRRGVDAAVPRPHLRWVGVLLLAVVAAIAGCAARRGGAVAPSDVARARAVEARLSKRLSRASDDHAARASRGIVRLVALSDPSGALADLRAVPVTTDPLAAFARLLAAEARLEHAQVLAVAEAAVAASVGRGPDSDWVPVATYAASRLGNAAEAVPDGRKRFRALLGRVPVERLPVPVRTPLLSYEGRLARIEGRDLAPVFERQGCVRTFTAGPAFGVHGAVDLPRIGAASLVTEAVEAPVVPLSCAVRVWNGTDHPAVRVLAAELAVGAGPLVLESSAGTPYRLYVDGEEVLRTDVYDRFPADWHTVAVDLSPGRHRVAVAVAIEAASAWVVVRAHDGRGRSLAGAARAASGPGVEGRGGGDVRGATVVDPVPARAQKGLLAPYRAELRRALALALALERGDSDRAERLADALRRRAPAFAEGRWLAARFERRDPSRGASRSRTRESRDLRAALEHAPDLVGAFLRTLELDLDRGERDRVRAALARRSGPAATSIDVDLFAADFYRSIEDELAVEQMLSRVRGRFPRHCGLLERELAIARARPRPADVDRLVAALDRCPRARSRRAAWARRRGRLEEAASYLAELLARTRDDETSAFAQVEVLAALGSYDEAATVARWLARLRPFDGGRVVRLADVLASAGRSDRARTLLRARQTELPSDRSLRAAVRALGKPDDLDRYRGDGLAAYRAFLEAPEVPEGVPEVLVYDRSVTKMYPDGTERTLVHLVTYLATKDAVDRNGEVALPQGAEVWTLRSLKPDGGTREPEKVAGKDTLSFRDLAVGDAVEVEYVVTNPPRVFLPGFLRGARFRFQSLDVPYWHSELVLVVPPEMDLRIERRADPPSPMETMVDGWRVLTFTARRMPRLGVEPHMRDGRDELPNVRVWVGDPLPWWNGALRRTSPDIGRTNPELRARARRVTKGATTAREKFDRLFRFVNRAIEPGGDFSMAPTATLASGRGYRMHVLRTMLREVGIHSEIWLGRTRFAAQPRPGGASMIDEYQTPILMVDLGGTGGSLPVLTEVRGAAPGYLPPGLSGARAFRLHLSPRDGPAGFVRLPNVGARFADRRSYDIEVRIGHDGRGTLEGRIALFGQEAIAWRRALDSLPAERHAEAFESAELSRLRLAATLSSVRFDDVEDVTKPLVLRFSAVVDAWGSSPDGMRVLPIAVVSANLARPYAALERRRTGLLIPEEPRWSLRLKVVADDETVILRRPAPVEVTTSAGHYERTVRATRDGRTVTVEVRSRLVAGVVEPDRYGDVRTLAQSVARSEGAVLVVGRAPSGTVSVGKHAVPVDEPPGRSRPLAGGEGAVSLPP